MKIEISLPESIITTLDLISKVCKKFLAIQRETPDKEVYEGKPSLGQPVPPEKTKDVSKTTPRKVPDDETFASLKLSEMIEIVKNPKNLNGFRFRAFAKCARQTYAGSAPEDNPVVQLVERINPGGINAILKTKNKDQAQAFINGVIELDKGDSDDVEF